jgi:hypothetical protein
MPPVIYRYGRPRCLFLKLNQNLQRLKVALQDELGGIEIRYIAKQLRIRGNFRADIEEFLQELGF